MSKKMLDDSLESDITGILLHEEKVIASKSYKSPEKKEYYGKLGVLSEVLKGTEIFLYNEENLLNKYPNGIITEDMIYLPRDKYLENLNHLKSKDTKSNSVVPSLLIISLVNYISNITESKFTEEEKAIIASQAIGKNELKIVSEEPEYMKTKDFIDFLKTENFGTFTIDFISKAKANTNYINNVIADSKEINNPDNPLSQLKEKLTIQPLELLDKNITHVKLEEVIAKNPLDPIPTLSLKKEGRELVETNTIENLSTDIIKPFIEKMLLLPIVEATTVLNSFVHDIHEVKKPLNIEIEKIARYINEYLDVELREALIAGITLFDDNSYITETMNKINRRSNTRSVFEVSTINEAREENLKSQLKYYSYLSEDTEELKKALINVFEINDKKMANTNKMKI